MIQDLEKRFGTLAVEYGFITIDQLVKAMNIQIMEEALRRKHRLIGEILVEQEFITTEQVDKVLENLLVGPY